MYVFKLCQFYIFKNNRFDSKKVELNKTIDENEVMIGTKEAISIETKDDMKIRTNIKEVSNLNIKLRSVKSVDKENTSDVVEIEKASKIPVIEILGAASNQNTDTLSCLPDSINITLLQDITVNTDENDENLNDEMKVIETAKNRNNPIVVLAI